MNENTFNKILVCLYVCFTLQVRLSNSRWCILNTSSNYLKNEYGRITWMVMTSLIAYNFLLGLHLHECKLVCDCVCMFPWVPRKLAQDSRKNRWKGYYAISYLDQMSFNLILLLYNVLLFWPRKGVWGEGRTNGNYQITPQLLTLQQILLWAKLLKIWFLANFV